MQVICSLSHRAICIALTLALAFGFLFGAFAQPKKAHALAFVVPAGAAAAGLSETGAIAAAGAAMAAAGVSLAALVGAQSSNVRDWTDEQLGRAGDILDNWLSNHQKWQEQTGQAGWNTAIQKVESGGGNGNKNEPPKNPNKNDFDGNSLWYLLTCINTSYVSVKSLDAFMDSLFDTLFSAKGVDGDFCHEQISYPNLSLSLDNQDFSFTVSEPPFVPSGSYASFSDYLCYGWNASPSSSLYPAYAFSNRLPDSVTLLNRSDLSPNTFCFRFDFGTQSHTVKGFRSSEYQLAQSTGVSSFDVYFNASYSSSMILSPATAKLLDSAYQNTTTTTVNNKYVFNDNPTTVNESLNNKDVDTIKAYLDSISSAVDAVTGTKKYTYVNSNANDVLPSNYPDSITQTEVQPQPITPKPGSAIGTIEVPDDYSFPDSWTKLHFERMFPFFFFDDLYDLLDKWLPAGDYKSKFSITVPSFWGDHGAKSKTLTVDATPFEKYRLFVRGIFEALVFVGLVARMFTWWGGFVTGGAKED